MHIAQFASRTLVAGYAQMPKMTKYWFNLWRDGYVTIKQTLHRSSWSWNEYFRWGTGTAKYTLENETENAGK